MSIGIRRAELLADRNTLVDLLCCHLTKHSDVHRFDWLYCNSPFGEARVWLAYDQDGAAIGAAAAFPRRFYVDGRETGAFVLGDFCMAPEHRSLGPSLQLQRACLAGIHERCFEFCYDFPSEKMMAIYRRLEFRMDYRLVRWAKPLRVESRLQSIVGSKRLAQTLSVVANAAAVRRGWRGDKSSCDIVRHDGPCSQEFTALDESLRARAGIHSVRTAEFLNWRFLSHPVTKHVVLTARRKARLIGYVVFSSDKEDASIVDLSCIQEPAVIARLLDGAIDQLRQLGTVTVSLNAHENHPWSNVFERAGFHRREQSPLIVGSLPGASLSDSLFQESWFLMRGDRDS